MATLGPEFPLAALLQLILVLCLQALSALPVTEGNALG